MGPIWGAAMAPQRLRLGRVRGPTTLGVLAAALLIAALVITGRSQDRIGRPPSSSTAPTAAADTPYRLDGGYRCPLGRPVLAMADGRSYPPGHPARPPPDARAVGCYQTPQEAAAAGYRPAPLPAGALVIGGVYLAPTDRALGSRCQLAADRLGFAVPCPGLLPTSAPGTAPPELCGRESPCDRGRGFFFRWEGFEVPPGYLGVDKQPQGSLEITAAPTRQPTGVVNLACETERRIATVGVQGRRAVLVGCPGWSSSGQVTLRWSQAGTRISVSLQGASVVNQQLAVALATHLRLVRPRT
jgi:hypothetical protein